MLTKTLTPAQIRFLIKLGGGTEELSDPAHPRHHDCIKNAVENAFTLLETATAYENELDQKRFDATWKNL